jgi:hypothetical protein
MSTPEGRVKLIIRAHLQTVPHCYFFMPAANGYGKAGVPDFIGHINGVFFAIEAKSSGGKVSALQKRELQKITAANGWAIVVTGEDEAHALHSWTDKLTRQGE